MSAINRDGWKVGDLVSGTFVYEARSVHFYIITAVTDSTVTVEEVQNYNTWDDGYGQNGAKDIVQPIVKLGRVYKCRRHKNGYYKIDGWLHMRKYSGEEDFYSD